MAAAAALPAAPFAAAALPAALPAPRRPARPAPPMPPAAAYFSSLVLGASLASCMPLPPFFALGASTLSSARLALACFASMRGALVLGMGAVLTTAFSGAAGLTAAGLGAVAFLGITGAEGLPTAGLGAFTVALVTGAGLAAFVGSGTANLTSGRRRSAFSALALPGLGYWAPGAAVFGTGAVFTAAFAGAAAGFFLETCASSMSLAVSVPSRRAEMASAGEAVDSATAAAAATAAAFEASRSSLTAEHTTARLVLTR